jgi:hypothetical protein
VAVSTERTYLFICFSSKDEAVARGVVEGGGDGGQDFHQL